MLKLIPPLPHSIGIEQHPFYKRSLARVAWLADAPRWGQRAALMVIGVICIICFALMVLALSNAPSAGQLPPPAPRNTAFMSSQQWTLWVQLLLGVYFLTVLIWLPYVIWYSVSAARASIHQANLDLLQVSNANWQTWLQVQVYMMQVGMARAWYVVAVARATLGVLLAVIVIGGALAGFTGFRDFSTGFALFILMYSLPPWIGLGYQTDQRMLPPMFGLAVAVRPSHPSVWAYGAMILLVCVILLAMVSFGLGSFFSMVYLLLWRTSVRAGEQLMEHYSALVVAHLEQREGVAA
jgi:hypothetical protein